MRDGFIKVGSFTPKIKVGDCEFNRESIINGCKEASEKGVKILVFPELCVTGYTCSDLFLHNTLIEGSEIAVKKIVEETKDLDMLIFVGAPVLFKGKLYNCTIAIKDGEILGIIPKTHLPNYGEFYEMRQFTPAFEGRELVHYCNKLCSMGTKILFEDESISNLRIGCEICEDLWAPSPVSVSHAMAGANLIVNLSASNELVGKDDYRKELVKGQSARLIAGYIYSNAGDGESTTDVVFSGQSFICENGSILAESDLFENGLITSEIDIDKLNQQRKVATTFPPINDEDYDKVRVKFNKEETELTRPFSPYPFVPFDEGEKSSRCNMILAMQSAGLKKRVEHSFAKTMVLGISGGLDSTLALLVCVNAIDKLKRDRKEIVAVTMPCFGTTKRTKRNAEILCESLGVTLKTIDISKAVHQHFEDISHDENVHDVVYENSQARERTKILMDIANQTGGIVVGTGDLSELALGWATYNGDHMSMYGVNCGVPKTLIRHIVKFYADTAKDEALKNALYDVLDTPVSPELLPPKDGEISQVTEDIVGPYELHDFYLYYAVRWAFSPSKIFRLAVYAFNGKYGKETILKWLKTFYRRFFQQQFKRSCLPDGPKIGAVSLSPRGDLRMPSDACANLWLKELENIEI